ncbi:hypothetical protein [Pseudoduganella sp. HUAS MS19]
MNRYDQQEVMMRSTTEGLGSHSVRHEMYTVICKSGQRGIEFSDARLAALAFLRAPAYDRPFVLRHQGNATHVIASAKAGTKLIEPGRSDDTFRTAYESVATTGAF